MSVRKSKRQVIKPLYLLALVVIIAAAGYLVWHSLHHNKAAQVAKVTGTPSTPTPHSTAPSTNNSPSNQGGIVDKNGQSSGNLPPSSDWISSSSGNITLQQPSANSTVSSGDTLSGLAKVSNVQFILSDSTVGQIAQGSLNVVNGKFAGTLQFTPHSTSGKLEVYYPNPSNGAEEDMVNVDVNFNTQ